MQLPDKIYDILKWISLVFCYAAGLLYKTLAAVWGLPYGEEVLTTFSAIGLFIGTLIGVSTAEYRKNNVGKHEAGNVAPYYDGFEEDE
jgi:hypothetical protein